NPCDGMRLAGNPVPSRHGGEAGGEGSRVGVPDERLAPELRLPVRAQRAWYRVLRRRPGPVEHVVRRSVDEGRADGLRCDGEIPGRGLVYLLSLVRSPL